jgi:hypothetical protein
MLSSIIMPQRDIKCGAELTFFENINTMSALSCEEYRVKSDPPGGGSRKKVSFRSPAA